MIRRLATRAGQVAAMLVAAACGSDGRGAVELARDGSAEAEVVGAARWRFAVVAAAGDYVELAVAQRGVDVAVDVQSPRGDAVIAALDLASGTAGSERTGFIARETGRHAIEIRAAYPEIARGRFELALRGPRPADAGDRRRAAAYAIEDELVTLVGWKPGHGTAPTGQALEAARGRCEALEAEWRALGDRRGAGLALELCATTARQLGRGEDAEALSERSLAIYRELGWVAAEGASLLERGSARYLRGDVADARASWQRAFELAERAGDPGIAADALNGMGIASLSVEDYRRARDELMRARERAAAIGHEDAVALADDNLGRTYARLGDAELAIDHHTRALAVFERGGGGREAGRTHHALALVRRDLLDDPAGARAELDRALAMLHRAGSRDGECIALVDLGLALRDDDPAAAARRLDEAVALGRAIGNALLLARARAAQALVALERGAIEAALDAYSEARAGFADARAPSAEAMALVGHARARIARGEVDAARRELAEALALLEDVRARAPSPELRATYFARVRSAYDLDIDLRMQLDRGRSGPDAARAFEASERARSRGLLEVLHAGGGDPAAVAPAERAALDTAGAEVARLEAAHAALLSGAPPAPQVRASEAAIAAAMAHQREALDALRARSPGAAELVAPAALTLGEAQRLLDDDSAVLEYVVAEPRSYVFAVTRGHFAARTLAGRTAIEAAARALRSALTARNAAVPGESADQRGARIALADAAAPTTAAHLAELVLAPVADAIAGKRRILIAPDGALAYTPFAVLPEVASPGAAALLDRHDLAVVPSMSVLAALRGRPRRRTGPVRIAVIADPVYGRDDPRAPATAAPPGGHSWLRLSFAADEAAAIAGLLPEQVRLATGLAAQRELLTGGALRDYDILHIAAHGAVNARYPEQSGLVLSMIDERGAPQDGVVRLHELYQLAIGADLVTLSGCDTALGRDIRGEGMIGLARGFLHAGARQVVASLWQVHDRATAELMRRFYDGMLARGLSPIAALRDAQRGLRDQTRYAAPYFWAAFELDGDDRP